MTKRDTTSSDTSTKPAAPASQGNLDELKELIRAYGGETRVADLLRMKGVI